MSIYQETYVGNDTLITFRLTNLGLQRDVSSGYTFDLEVEQDSDGTILTPITASSGETNADWVHGVVTVRLPESYTVTPQRLNISLNSTASGLVITEDTGVVLVQHRPGHV